MAPIQHTTQLPTSLALAGPIQQTSPLPTSMSLAGPIQPSPLPTSMSMAGPLQQSTPLPTSMRISGPLPNHPGQLPNAGPPNGVNGTPQQMQQTNSLPTTMSIGGSMQQTNALQTSMNISGPPLSHPGQHPGAGQQNGVTRSSQQTVSIAVQPLAPAHPVSSMAMPLQSHPAQTNVAPPSAKWCHEIIPTDCKHCRSTTSSC